MRVKKRRFYIPENLFLENKLPSHLAKYYWEAAYFVHLISWNSAMKNTDADGWVHLKFDYLRSAIPDKVLKPLKSWLLASGIVQTDGYYVKASATGRGKAYGYRLAPTYWTKTKLVLCDNDRLNKSLHKMRKGITDTVGQYLEAQLKLMTIDETALNHIQAADWDEQVKADQMLLVKLIQDRNPEASICSYGRFHSPFTRMKKELRQFIRFNGQSLEEVDVVNSQPLFLGQLVQMFRSNNDSFSSTSPSNSKNLKKTSTILSFPPPLLPAITTSNSIEDIDVNPLNTGIYNDEMMYQELCEDGKFYEVLQEETGMTDRKAMKEQLFFSVFYGETNISCPVKTSFKKLFPNVYKVILAAKKKDYRHLAQRMQKAESDLMIQTVCRRLMQDHPDVPVITIHDSIMTTAAHIDLVASIINEAFAAIGLKVSLKSNGKLVALEPVRLAVESTNENYFEQCFGVSA